MDSDQSHHYLRQRKHRNEEGKWETLEKPTIRSRGQAALDAFNSRDEIQHLEFNGPMSQEELKNQNFQFTSNQVAFRKATTQGTLVGVQVKVGPNVIKTKTGYDYLSEGLRTVAVQMRDMLLDLNKLSKMLQKQEFQQTSYFS